MDKHLYLHGWIGRRLDLKYNVLTKILDVTRLYCFSFQVPEATPLSILQDITHPVESWTLFLCPLLLSALVPLEEASVETGFFASMVFTMFLAPDLVLSPNGFDFEVVMVAFLVSLHLISLSFPSLPGVFFELAALDSLIFFNCLQS